MAVAGWRRDRSGLGVKVPNSSIVPMMVSWACWEVTYGLAEALGVPLATDDDPPR